MIVLRFGAASSAAFERVQSRLRDPVEMIRFLPRNERKLHHH